MSQEVGNLQKQIINTLNKKVSKYIYIYFVFLVNNLVSGAWLCFLFGIFPIYQLDVC